ncbi:ecotropic viral integration site 5 protein [Pyrenophora tritici-repentis Pt-1C-BFP]|uniref:Ecotropic viral integration site 5 protein n=1 Tax=Pyrenophora tritici-repentis (strain Pt-1C-BFP) TaxID=426418 RepID=B2VS87_PYRTR|nr:ecotropic viral integration site 5 protein [Pyrenophora tritici-repentis Pt-1C-BFP]EDU41151.1 ecotropic viral integration site 5 protein [Pyrenophora tritici-repentis Pt-1C-BFP]
MSTSTVQVETTTKGDDVSMANMDAAQNHLEAEVEEAPTEKRSRTHVDSKPLPTDSMVTVPLSDTGDKTPEDEQNQSQRESATRPAIIVEERRASSRTNSAEIRNAFGRRSSQGSIDSPTPESPTISVHDADAPVSPKADTKRRSNSDGSGKSVEVDWAELEKKEEQEPEGEEEENEAIMSNSKANTKVSRARSQSRPPSFNHLKRLVAHDTSQMRFSQLPSPPPMTELEFWAALVRDYPQTVQRLPTLCLNKIRGGIPPPLRGVVWQSAAGSREKLIEDQYDTLCGESSPYENTINKDLGRSFPGVEMFKDPDGEGQKMLGRVLKCFSLYDHKIGYCQGLGFLVGPLLMQMGDKEAFCVLVRLMEDYDLRSCFLPDLSGLHLRIFQFQKLLHQHMPQLAQHLDTLGVESAYLSQWFLSFFAVTCPLPMLFRIYDVLFAEGASETIMRVALALMKRNEQKLLSLSEFEDVMQLLLGRQLWDPYGRKAGSADELVGDFVGFTNDVTRERLQGLEQQYKEAQEKDSSKQQVQKSATSFLGRLWGPSNSSTKSVSLSPGLSAPSRPVSFLRRSASKQSLASTLNSTAESDSSAATASTAMTDLSRASNGDAMSVKSGHGSVAMGLSAKDRDLHYQIEQLLMSVSQLQRQNSELEAALQKQREDRSEDHRIVRTVVEKVRKKTPTLAAPSTRTSRRRTTVTAATDVSREDKPTTLTEEATEIVSTLESRFPAAQLHHRASSMFETKQLLRENITRIKEQLANETLRANSLARDLSDRDAELQIARDALKDTRHRLQDSYNQSQRQEKTIQELRQMSRKQSAAASWSGGDSYTPDTPPSLSRSTTSDSVSGGLRELRLGRTPSQKSDRPSHSQQSTYAKRSSSLLTQSVLATENNAPADSEALLLELVNAKTAEAVARQELEELRSRFEGMKRVISGSGTGSPVVTPSPVPKETGAAAGGGWGWGGWKRTVSSSNVGVGGGGS